MALELFPVEHPKNNNPATLCQASPILGCTQSSFPSKIPSAGKPRQLEHDHLSMLEEEEPESQTEPSQEPESLPSFYFHALEAFNFSANPILDGLPLPRKLLQLLPTSP